MTYCMKYDVWRVVTFCTITHEGCAIGIPSKVPKVVGS